MRFTRQKKEPERYYLLPGQGGRGRRQKVRRMLLWGMLGGLATSLVVAGLLYGLCHGGRGVL